MTGPRRGADDPSLRAARDGRRLVGRGPHGQLAGDRARWPSRRWAELGDDPGEPTPPRSGERASFDVERVARARARHPPRRRRVRRRRRRASIGEAGRWIHFGHDVVRRARHGARAAAAGGRRRAARRLERLLGVVKRLALEHRDTVMHRAHARRPRRADHASGTSSRSVAFQLDRDRERLRRAREAVSVGSDQRRGRDLRAASTRGSRSSSCARLGLRPAEASTQIIQRDRHAEFMSRARGAAPRR